jgi:hypothetical protein
MSIFKRKGLKEKDIVGLVDKLDAAPPSPSLNLKPRHCDYCGREVTSYMLSISFQDPLAGTDDGRIVCWPCGFQALDGIVKLFTGQTRKEKV